MHLLVYYINLDTSILLIILLHISCANCALHTPN